MQHSVATDITDSESHGFSVAGILAEVVIGLVEDMGYAEWVKNAVAIATDNDATLRIASDAASAKRAFHILRRMARTRHLVESGIIAAIKIARDLNLADLGTHYNAGHLHKYFRYKLRNM